MVRKILRSASDLLLSEGPSRFTATRIAEYAGISAGTLYQYFPNKISILKKLIKEDLCKITQALDGSSSEIKKDGELQLKEFLEIVFYHELNDCKLRTALRSAEIFFNLEHKDSKEYSAHEILINSFLKGAYPKAPNEKIDIATYLISSAILTASLRWRLRALSILDRNQLADILSTTLTRYLDPDIE